MARSEFLRIDPVCELIRSIERHAENIRRTTHSMSLSWAEQYRESHEAALRYSRQSIQSLLNHHNKLKTTTTETEV